MKQFKTFKRKVTRALDDRTDAIPSPHTTYPNSSATAAPTQQYASPGYHPPEYLSPFHHYPAPHHLSPQEPSPSYTAPQYASPQYASPQHAPPQYASSQYTASPYGHPPPTVTNGLQGAPPVHDAAPAPNSYNPTAAHYPLAALMPHADVSHQPAAPLPALVNENDSLDGQNVLSGATEQALKQIRRHIPSGLGDRLAKRLTDALPQSLAPSSVVTPSTPVHASLPLPDASTHLADAFSSSNMHSAISSAFAQSAATIRKMYPGKDGDHMVEDMKSTFEMIDEQATTNGKVDVVRMQVEVTRQAMVRAISSGVYADLPLPKGALDWTKTFPKYAEIMKGLEKQQESIPGPQWCANSTSADMAFGMENNLDKLRLLMSGLEDGAKFCAYNQERYAEVGDVMLDGICKGLSRELDISRGPAELFALRDQVNQLSPRLEAGKTMFGVSTQAVRQSHVPIFAVSYRHCEFSEWWRMSEGQMHELFAVLHVVTGGGRVRLWCDRIIPRTVTNNGRWEAIGLLPYTMFPVIAIGCEGTFAGAGAEDRLWLEIERHMALSCLGLVTIVGKVRATRQARFLEKGHVASRVQSRLIKVMGDGEGVGTALMIYSNFMLRGGYSTATSSTYDVEGSLKETATRWVLGSSIEDLMTMEAGHSGGEGLKMDKATTYERLAASAMDLGIGKSHMTNMVPQFVKQREVGCDTLSWDGSWEFCDFEKIRPMLGLGQLRRTYTCMFVDAEREMVVFATAHGPSELAGLMLVRRDGDCRRSGAVMAWISNIVFPGGANLVSQMITDNRTEAVHLGATFSMVRRMLRREKYAWDGSQNEGATAGMELLTSSIGCRVEQYEYEQLRWR